MIDAKEKIKGGNEIQRRDNIFERIFWSPFPIYGMAIVLILLLIATLLTIRQQ